ncbi:subtilisin-like protein [Roridomyces roridus]|uniref:Subtilisin-like protein n=1 Tax=Roridomyces roridus TaxID=1738132 RepID=A0AAD7BDZ5_9AGAR|nr:subtilisin-like protein [Roridomyces roridus]
MPFFRFLSVVALVAYVSAGLLVLHHRRSSAPDGFTNEGPVSPDVQLTMQFALTSKNISGLHDTLMAISTPGNSAFRRWLSKDEVKSFVEPSAESLSAFHTFASKNGLVVESNSAHGDWVSVTMVAGQINALFGAQFARFSHRALDQPITRTLSISLPQELVGHVEAILPSTSFSLPRQSTDPLASVGKRTLVDKRPHPAASCNTSDPTGVLTPLCIQDIYGIPSTPACNKDNRLLIPVFNSKVPERDSLASFLTQFRPDMSPNTTFNLIQINNATNPNLTTIDPDVLEPDLDVQYTIGSEADVGEPIARQEISAKPKKLCNTFASLSARGISVLFASGDGGVRGVHDNPTQCNQTTFIPVFPSSCPWVITIGGTQGFSPEVATNFTGGGFSNLFPQPAYQKSAVNHYLKHHLPTSGTFNKTGRAYPDIAVQASDLAVFFANRLFTNGAGTSYSGPILGSMIALVNDRLLAAGKKPLGFLNPWLYHHQAAWTDITAGRNPGFTCPMSAVAFDAVEGWDPLTGLGTPMFDKLVQAAFENC